MHDSPLNFSSEEQIRSSSQEEKPGEKSSSEAPIVEPGQDSSETASQGEFGRSESALPSFDSEEDRVQFESSAICGEDAADFAEREATRESAPAPAAAGADSSEASESEESEAEPPPVTLEDLSNEVRRLGRELFKVNRALGYNQETFESALEELRRSSAMVAQIVSQIAAQRAETLFEAKAPLCRELLSVADSLDAGLESSGDVLTRLGENADQRVPAIVARIPAVRKLQTAVTDSADRMRQWQQGQELLLDRLKDALRASGVREVSARDGQRFDPELHRAVSVDERDDVPSGSIVGEELRGYSLDGRILRYAEVIVAKHEPNSWD